MYWTTPHPGSPLTTTATGGYWYGWIFTPSVSGLVCSGFEYYNPSAGSGYNVYLADQGTGAILRHYTGHTEATTGWKTHAWDDGDYNLVNGTVYGVMLYGGSLAWSLQYAAGFAPTSPTGVTINRQGYSLYNTAISGTPGAPELVSAAICPPNAPVIPPDPTPAAKPTGFPDAPAAGTCTTVQDVCNSLLSLDRRLSDMFAFVKTIQRYRVPFGVVEGTLHTGLSGTGSLSLPGIVGLRVTITTNPPGPVLTGNPPYLWDRGWLSVNDAAGMLAEKRLTRTSFEWFPDTPGLITTFQWSLTAAVVIEVQELEPVP